MTIFFFLYIGIGKFSEIRLSTINSQMEDLLTLFDWHKLSFHFTPLL